MLKNLETNTSIAPNPIGRNLPTTRANILHTLGQKKTVNYELDPNYRGIKISPKILYRLQSAKVGFSRSFGKGAQTMDITDSKLILTDQKEDGKNTKFIIKSCINNPINLEDPDKKPNYRKHVEYNGKDYFFVSFNHNAIDGYAQEDFMVTNFEEGKGLETKEICRVEYASSRKVDIIDIDGVPTLQIQYGNPDAPGGVYEEGEYKHEIRFNLKDQETKTRNGFYRYRTGKTERND